MRKIIEMNHHSHDYECMWNGIEDIYMNKTKEILPDNFFFILASFGSFCYLKTNQSDIKRLVTLGDGRTRKMYEFMAPIVGFDYHHYEFKRFESALNKAKKEIDAGFPVVLGALDMFYLPYYRKLYEKEHIPFHYVLMVGYDDEQRTIFLYDCGRTELLPLSYDLLQDSMNCSYPGLSKENTICTVRFTGTKSKYEIAREALSKRKDMFLNPPTGFLGYKGFEKFINELSQWKNQLTKEDYDKILLNMVTFYGTVPTVPNALKGIEEPDEVEFKGGFDKVSRMLYVIGKEYNNDSCIRAGELFGESATVIEKISSIIIAYLLREKDETDQLPLLFSEVLTGMKNGFLVLDV